MKKYWSSLYILLGMIALTFYVIFRNYQLGEVFQRAKNANSLLLLLGFVMVILHMVLGGWALKKLMWSMNRTPSLMACSKYYAIEFYFSAITPSATGGQPAQAYYMAKDGLPASLSTIALLLVAVVYKLVLLFLSIFVLFTKMELVIHRGPWVLLLFILGFVINVVVIWFCLACMFSKTLVRSIVTKAIRLLTKIHMIKRPQKTMEAFEVYCQGLQEGADYIRKHKKVSVEVFFITFLQRMCLFSVGYLVYRALGLSSAGYIDLLGVQVVTAIAVDSLPLPGGVGASEALIMVLYHGIYNASSMVSAMLLTRGISFYFYLIFSGVISVVNHLALMAEQKKMGGY